MMIQLNATAPIVPGVGMAGVKLRMHISECFDLIRGLRIRGEDLPGSFKGEAFLQAPYLVAFNLDIGITMVFNVINGRLYKIVADKRYKGLLLGALHTGMPFQDALSAEPRLCFNEMEEVWTIPGVKGVAVDTDAFDRHIEAISVYVAELDDAIGDIEKTEAFERGKWS